MKKKKTHFCFSFLLTFANRRNNKKKERERTTKEEEKNCLCGCFCKHIIIQCNTVLVILTKASKLNEKKT